MGKAYTLIEDFDPHGPFGVLLLPPRFRKRIKETRFIQRWKLTIPQYLQMMREFRGPKRQRGIICAVGVYPTLVSGAVNLSNHTGVGRFHDERFSAGTAESGVSFENDGQMWERNDHSSDTQYNAEWWDDEPTTDIGDSYSVRALSAGKTGSWTESANSDDVWSILTSTKNWRRNRTTNGSSTVTATFEVGPQPTGPADASASIEVRATIDAL